MSISRFQAKYSVEDATGCWLWTASRNHKGYGHFFLAGRVQQAHRASWLIFHGSIPAGCFVLHRCDRPACVNPDHLWLGTHADNMADRGAKGRVQRYNATKTHCIHGHEFTDANTYRDRAGRRSCRRCHANTEIARYRARKEMHP